MSRYRFSWLVLLLPTFGLGMAKASDSCGSVLRPNEEQMQPDFALIQAYMSEHAASEFDRFRRMDSRSRSNDTVFKLSSNESSESRTREEIQERIRSHLERERFNMSLQQREGLLTSFVTDQQVEAWIEWKNVGLVRLKPQFPKNEGFNLNASWNPPVEVGGGGMKIEAEGATIAGNASVGETWTGRSPRHREPPQLEISEEPKKPVACEKYRETLPNRVACNSNTSDGYYWRTSSKIEHYSVLGVISGQDQPPCGEDTVNSLATTARFPLRQSFFLPVHKNWQNVSTEMTAPKCNRIGGGEKVDDVDRSSYCGIFEVICLKQPD